jgi:hypothetical protein
MKINPFASYHSGLPLKTSQDRQQGAIRTMSGRIAVVTALALFSICYALGIVHFGVLAGMAIGWLPSGVIAWLSAHLTFQLAQFILPALLPSGTAR